jgi:hypothetical protein
VTAELFAATPGVTVTQSPADYPDIGPGDAWTNLIPFQLSVEYSLDAGIT